MNNQHFLYERRNGAFVGKFEAPESTLNIANLVQLASLGNQDKNEIQEKVTAYVVSDSQDDFTLGEDLVLRRIDSGYMQLAFNVPAEEASKYTESSVLTTAQSLFSNGSINYKK